ncbi:MAG: sigma-54 dependent transcriptional regulator [Smithellaceae bacterium]|nr:sigma-54 dependent transcriptional regulator [Smithellaceae bacterium]
MKHRILVVEDDAVAGEFLCEVLGRVGYEVDVCCSADDSFSLDLSAYDLLISDIRMPGRDGLELLGHVHDKWPELPVIMVTAYGSLETAMEALRLGAFDYIGKPFSPEEIRSLVSKVLEVRELQRRQQDGRAREEETYRFVGSSSAMVEIYKLVARVADTTVSVLIEGESGTGKELAARALHQLSSRRLKPFMAVHCGAIPDNLLESELFGYEKGSFTGADHQHLGLLDKCVGGTIFLDEITEMSPALQGKLLRFMQNGEVRRIGGHEVRLVDVRVVAATNRNIDEVTKKGVFRADLLHRFVIRISMPPLREHREDLPQLLEATLRKFGYLSVRLSQEAMELLMGYDWPGNVRELENVLQQTILLSSSALIRPDNLPARFHRSAEPTESPLSPLEEAQRKQIIQTLKITGWNQSRAAQMLGIDRKTLRSRIHHYQIVRPDFT